VSASEAGRERGRERDRGAEKGSSGASGWEGGCGEGTPGRAHVVTSLER
jgi:hypothetical protein